MTMTDQETTMIVDLSGSDVQTFGRIIANISKTVATSRPGPMEYVQIRQDGDTIVFQTTDSYRAITAIMPVHNNGTGTIPTPILVNGKQLVKAAKLIGRKTEHVTVTFTGNHVTVTTGDGSMNVETGVDTWPDVNRIYDDARGYRFPNSGDEIQTSHVDALLLADTLAVAGKIIGGEQPKINLHGTGAKDTSGRGPWYWSGGSSSDVTVEILMMGLR